MHSIELLYIKIYISFIKANDNVYDTLLFIVSSRFTTKKEKILRILIIFIEYLFLYLLVLFFLYKLLQLLFFYIKSFQFIRLNLLVFFFSLYY